jgi:hypothetical protein
MAKKEDGRSMTSVTASSWNFTTWASERWWANSMGVCSARTAVGCCWARWEPGRTLSSGWPRSLPITATRTALSAASATWWDSGCSLRLALGYEYLNDHDRLRLDPLLAVLVGKEDLTGQARACPRDKGKPLAKNARL